MVWLARSTGLLVATTWLLGTWELSAADDYRGYPPPQGWAEQVAPVAQGPTAQQPSSNWPAAAPAASNPPGLLPTPYETPQRPTRPASGVSPVAQVANNAAPRPLPPARSAANAPSRLGELSHDGLPPLGSAAASLGIVLGLFLLVTWVVRRGMPRGSTMLPTEAVEVLGRATLAGRQQVQLVRCGNKVVLVSVSPTGAQALAEITDPAEVDRLHSICQPPGAVGGLRRFLSYFTGHVPTGDYYTHDDHHTLDFRHLETGSQHHA